MLKPTPRTCDADGTAVTVRPAKLDDLDALLGLETRIFQSDRISRRSFRALLQKPTAETIVAECNGELAGYALLLFRAGTALARLYSIGVDPAFTTQGLGKKLLAAAEASAFDHDKMMLRLEVRADNGRAIEFYRRHGYHHSGHAPDYYEDGQDALRFEKVLRGSTQPNRDVPYYEQTEDFTCGAACLLMAFAVFDPQTRLHPIEEIRLWRQATTIFMASGAGGCEPFGLAVTAAEHGFETEIYSSHDGALFLDTVRSAEKRRVMQIAQAGFRERAAELNIRAHFHPVSITDISQAIARGAVMLVMVSGYRMFSKKVPHWVLVHGDDGRHLIIHDPWIEAEEGETITDAANLPIPYAVFERMARFGRESLRMAVTIMKRAS